jgi:hypothetical protein
VSRFIHVAMKWQPMPASARLPSGTRVEVLCGQPEQKYGVRLTPSAPLNGSFGGAEVRQEAARSSAGNFGASHRTSAGAMREGRSSPSADSSGSPSRSGLADHDGALFLRRL